MLIYWYINSLNFINSHEISVFLRVAWWRMCSISYSRRWIFCVVLFVVRERNTKYDQVPSYRSGYSCSWLIWLWESEWFKYWKVLFSIYQNLIHIRIIIQTYSIFIIYVFNIICLRWKLDQGVRCVKSARTKINF